MIEGTVATQFETLAAAASGCELIVGATALQIAAPSVAERMGIPYVFAAYCPTVLPSPHHAPPVLTLLRDTPAPSIPDYSDLWAQDERRWNDMWGSLINAQRASLGLHPILDVRRYVLTDRPWLAANPTLAPWPDPADDPVFQIGAWRRDSGHHRYATRESLERHGFEGFYVTFRLECVAADSKVSEAWFGSKVFDVFRYTYLCE